MQQNLKISIVFSLSPKIHFNADPKPISRHDKCYVMWLLHSPTYPRYPGQKGLQHSTGASGWGLNFQPFSLQTVTWSSAMLLHNPSKNTPLPLLTQRASLSTRCGEGSRQVRLWPKVPTGRVNVAQGRLVDRETRAGRGRVWGIIGDLLKVCIFLGLVKSNNTLKR